MEEKLVSKTKGLSKNESDSTNEIGLANTLELSDQNHPCDVYFDVLSQKHIDILDSFVSDYKKNIDRINGGLMEFLNITDSAEIDNFLNNSLDLDVIKIPESTNDYDLVVICSKSSKVLFFKTKKSYAIEFKNKIVVRVTKGNGLEYA